MKAQCHECCLHNLAFDLCIDDNYLSYTKLLSFFFLNFGAQSQRKHSLILLGGNDVRASF